MESLLEMDMVAVKEARLSEEEDETYQAGRK
jgi:hypothetical protein